MTEVFDFIITFTAGLILVDSLEEFFPNRPSFGFKSIYGYTKVGYANGMLYLFTGSFAFSLLLLRFKKSTPELVKTQLLLVIGLFIFSIVYQLKRNKLLSTPEKV